jgi:hypothetical protein
VSDDALAGKWTKVGGDPGSSGYPDELELLPGGRYVGGMRPGAREHARWDVGTYRRLADGLLGITTANDALGRYRFTLDGERLTLIDEAGATIAYRRADDTSRPP